jgi:nitrite reductase (NO-forming)
VNTLGVAAAFVACGFSIAAFVRSGRRPDVRKLRERAQPLGAVVVLVAAATTGGALYATEASRATAPHATAKDPVWWNLQQVPHGAAAANEAPIKSAEVPPLLKGKVVRLTIKVENKTIEIAPGVQVNAWTFNGSVPAPTIHLQVGQKVILKFVNGGSTWHSFDSHGTEIPYQHANQDIGVGQTKTFTWTATKPGIFLYHCFTFPGAVHIAAGMYGAMVVDDPKQPLPKADKTFLLEASEWYLDGDGQSAPANTDARKAQSGFPDYATFNGYWQEYSYRPLHVNPGKLVRFIIVNAGPNFPVAFHVVGGIFDRIYADGALQNPEANVQTSDVAPGGAAIFDITFHKVGVYNFVNHLFANAVKGQLGELVVGNPTGAG